MPTIRICPKCRTSHYGNPSVCSRCGYVFKRKGLGTGQGALLIGAVGVAVLACILLFLWLPGADPIPNVPPIPDVRPTPASPPAEQQPLPAATPPERDPEPAPAPERTPSDLKSVIQQAAPAVVRIDSIGLGYGSIGSGFLIDGAGHVITNAHVIAGGVQTVVTTGEGEQYEAMVLRSDPYVDLALLEVQGLVSSPYLRLGSSAHLEQGDHVVALGSPEGLTNSVSDGIISAVNRTIQMADGKVMEGLIQTTAPISHGSSGGPLIEVATGNVIGVTTAGSETGDNLGFAVTSDTVLDTLEQWGVPIAE